MHRPVHRTDGVHGLLAYLLQRMLAALSGLDAALPDMQTYHGSGGSAESVSLIILLKLILMLFVVLNVFKFLLESRACEDLIWDYSRTGEGSYLALSCPHFDIPT